MKKEQGKKTKSVSSGEKYVEGLTDGQRAIFDKYANKYDVDKEPTQAKHNNIAREKYIYELLNKKGVENTAVEKLLDLTVKDIEFQYYMKQAMEYKIGFMIALWGVLVAAVIQNGLPWKIYRNMVSVSTDIWLKIGCGIVLVGMVISGLMILPYMVLGLTNSHFRKFQFDDRDENFRCAVEDKNMLLVKLLDSNTTVWEKNEDSNDKIFTHLRKLVIYMVAFIFFIILGFVFR